MADQCAQAVAVCGLCSGAAVSSLGGHRLDTSRWLVPVGAVPAGCGCGGESGTGSKLTTSRPFHCCFCQAIIRRQGQTLLDQAGPGLRGGEVEN